MPDFIALVTLYVHEGCEPEFSAFEEAAFKLLEGYRGELLYRVRLAERASALRAPYEFHLLRFPSEAAFEAYLSCRGPYEDERERLIARTHVLTGVAIPAHGRSRPAD